MSYGRHEYYLSRQERIATTKYNVILNVVLVMSSCFSKISVCFLLLRLLKDAVARKRKLFLWSLIVLLSIYNVVDIISLLVQCRPTAYIWDKAIQGSCWDPEVQDGFAYMQGGAHSRVSRLHYTILILCLALTIFAAFSLSAFPVLVVKDLQMNMRTKVALCLLLGLGVL